MRSNTLIWKNLDWITIIIYLTLVMFGWINIYSAVYNHDNSNIFDMSQRYGKQLLWIGAALVIAVFILIIDPKFFKHFSPAIYIIHIISLIALLLLGKVVAGSKSWFEIGSFSIQPAEFVKYATALLLANYLSSLNLSVSNLKTIAIACVIIFVPSALIILQNDTGSALVYCSFIFVLYRRGLSGNIFIIIFLVGLTAILALLLQTIVQKLILIGVIFLIFVGIYYFLKKSFKTIIFLSSLFILFPIIIFSTSTVFNKLQPHQQVRIKVLLNMEQDLKNAGYNVHQSKIAIGSGGFAGKGFLNGTQTKFDFVPEQCTDFIFCTVGEEWGFIGASLLIIVFILLLIRIIYMAERQRSVFSQIYGYGVASILFFHITINVGMVLGLIPVIGIPLPFFSYGGSSLWAFTILLFIFIRQDAERMNVI